MKKVKEEKSVFWIRVIFLIYLIILIKVIVFKYPLSQMKEIVNNWEKDVIWEGLGTANFTLFKTIKMYIKYSYKLNSFENLIGNIVAFVPFGFMLPYVMKWGKYFWVMFLNAFIFVLGIELFQLFSAFGAFDVDDILLNCMGAVWGWLFYFIFDKVKRYLKRREGLTNEKTERNETS